MMTTGRGPDGSGLDEGRGRSVPVHEFAGIEIDVGRSRDGRGVATMPLGEAVRGFVAPLHGGMLATLVDNACAATLIDACDLEVEVPVTRDMHLRFHRQPKASPITAEARIVHQGSTIIDIECVVSDGKDRPLARASVSFVIVRGFGDPSEGRPS
jgi:uncharacterized protein (TIGR00369 family)